MKGQQRCFGNPEIMNYWKQLQPFGLVEQLEDVLRTAQPGKEARLPQPPVKEGVVGWLLAGGGEASE